MSLEDQALDEARGLLSQPHLPPEALLSIEDTRILHHPDLHPLHLVCENFPRADTVKTILELGVDVNAWSGFPCYETPLHVAVKNHANLDVVTCLLEHGADPNARDDHALTPIFYPVFDLRITEALLAYGAVPFTRDFRGNTFADSTLTQPVYYKDRFTNRDAPYSSIVSYLRTKYPVEMIENFNFKQYIRLYHRSAVNYIVRDYNGSSNGYTPATYILKHAAIGCFKEFVTQNRVNLEYPTCTPIWLYAVALNKAEALKFILERVSYAYFYKTFIEAITYYRTMGGTRYLSNATPEVIEVLRLHIRPDHRELVYGTTIFHTIAKFRLFDTFPLPIGLEDNNVRDSFGRTPLHTINSDANAVPPGYERWINAVDLIGNTPLHRDTLSAAFVKHAISLGADLSIKNIYGETALDAHRKLDHGPEIVRHHEQEKRARTCEEEAASADHTH